MQEQLFETPHFISLGVTIHRSPKPYQTKPWRYCHLFRLLLRRYFSRSSFLFRRTVHPRFLWTTPSYRRHRRRLSSDRGCKSWMRKAWRGYGNWPQMPCPMNSSTFDPNSTSDFPNNNNNNNNKKKRTTTTASTMWRNRRHLQLHLQPPNPWPTLTMMMLLEITTTTRQYRGYCCWRWTGSISVLYDVLLEATIHTTTTARKDRSKSSTSIATDRGSNNKSIKQEVIKEQPNKSDVGKTPNELSSSSSSPSLSSLKHWQGMIRTGKFLRPSPGKHPLDNIRSSITSSGDELLVDASKSLGIFSLEQILSSTTTKGENPSDSSVLVVDGNDDTFFFPCSPFGDGGFLQWQT